MKRAFSVPSSDTNRQKIDILNAMSLCFLTDCINRAPSSVDIVNHQSLRICQSPSLPSKEFFRFFLLIEASRDFWAEVTDFFLM